MNLGKSTPSLVEGLAAETSKGATQKSEFQNRLNRYGKAKEKAVSISDYIRVNHPNYQRLANDVNNCGSYLVFRDYFTVGEVRLSKACFCKKHLLCPLCAIRRGAKHLGRYIDRYEDIVKQSPSQKPYMVTFTVKDGPDLKERFNHLQKSLRYYHKLRHLKKRKCEAKKATAGVWSYEVKRGKNSGAWHPHVHAVWLCSEKPNQGEISSEWAAITGDSYIVDVREITPENPTKGFLEVFKYAVKFSDQPDFDTWHCFETLRGRRLIGSFGDFYGIPEPDDLTDDPLEGLPYVEHFYSYIHHLSGYRFQDVRELA